MLQTIVRDHVVGFISDDKIIASALRWRAAADGEDTSSFEVTSFIQKVLINQRQLPRPLRLSITDHPEGIDLCWVDYDPNPVLHVDRLLWEETKLGEPRGRFMLSHEIAHTIFHSHHAKAFSTFGEEELRGTLDQQRAEHHANLFADHFLVRDKLVKSIKDASAIAGRCNVEICVAERRVHDYAKKHLRSLTTTGDYCQNCCSPLFQRGLHVFCKNSCCLYEAVI